jgi:pimeloyl-ACP methyl ester carboxylesterase
MKPVYLPNEEAFLRYIEVPGVDPPILWLHGWQCSSTGELGEAPLEQPLRGRRSLLVDFLGHGYSDKPAGYAYTLEAHARTIVDLIETEGTSRCGIVGHSMGGAVAVLAAGARPEVVSFVVMAEGNVDAEPDRVVFDGQSEGAFVATGYDELLARQEKAAHADPTGLPAAHLGITRLVDPRALYREAVSMRDGSDPPVRDLLSELTMPRWYLQGSLSEQDDEFQRGLEALGVTWRIVPDTGHAMGLQNPMGLAEAVAEAVAQAWAIPP